MKSFFSDGIIRKKSFNSLVNILLKDDALL